MAIVRARLGRYGQWQLRDYLLGAGGITIVFVLLLVWIASRSESIGSNGDRHTPPLDSLVHLVALLGSIFATSNLISEDRSRGYYRFLFAKPMDPVRFYAQAFALRGLVVIAIAAFVAGIAGVFTTPISVPCAIVYAAISYVLVGGVTVCQSTVWRFAWVGSLIMFLASGAVAGLASPQSPIGPGWRAFWYVLHVLLPPFSQEDLLHRMLVSIPDWSALAGSIAWSLGYGVLALVAAVLVIKGLEWGR